MVVLSVEGAFLFLLLPHPAFDLLAEFCSLDKAVSLVAPASSLE